LTPTLKGATFVEWNLGTLPADTSQAVSLTLALDAKLASKLATSEPVTVTFKTTISTSASDSDPTNNSRSYIEEASLGGNDLKLWIQVAGTNEGTITSGQTLTYTLLYGNFGAQTALTPTLEAQLGEGLTLVSSTPPASGSDPLRWTVASLPVGETGQVTLRVHVDSIAEPGALLDATVYATNPDSNLLNNHAEDARFAAVAGGGGGSAIFLPSVSNK
jgi:uncharacterized repeat protein (TIGR01451 family)